MYTLWNQINDPDIHYTAMQSCHEDGFQKDFRDTSYGREDIFLVTE